MTASQTVNAAIVGLGRWGRNLVEAAVTDPENTLRFSRAVTRSPDKAMDFCKVHGLPLGADYQAILDDPTVDAVVIATPHSQHTAQIKAAAEAGKHVFVEKPLALTLEEGMDVAKTCERHGVILAVGFNRRFLPAYRAMEELLSAGDLGTPMHVEGNFSGPFGYDYADDMWRGSASENPAGGMAAMGIHALDAMINLLGPVKKVTAKSTRRVLKTSIDDTTTVMLEFSSGATGSLSTLMATASNWRLQLFGSAGWALMADQQSLETSILCDEPRRSHFEGVNTLAQELDSFARSIRGEAVFPVTISQALSGVAAMQAIAESAANDGQTLLVADGSLQQPPLA